MEYEDKEGICFFAYNNDKIDYIKLTIIAARYAKRYLNKPVCLITDTGTAAWLEQSQDKKIAEECFDYIVTTNDKFKDNMRGHFDSPWTEFRAQFKNSNKHKIWQYSPFEKTLLLDVDYIVKNDYLNHVWDSGKNVAMYDQARSIRNDMPHHREQWLYEAGIKMWWSTVVYFDRSEVSELFFDTWAHVADNYDYYQYLYNFPGKLFRTDYCVSVASHILNGMQDGEVISTFGDIPMFYMDQKDDIVQVDSVQDWIMLAHDQKEKWKNIVVKQHHLDVHAMNKRAIERNWSQIMELLDE